MSDYEDYEDRDDQEPTEQQENLERVRARIAPFVLDFCRAHKRFYAEELRRYVVEQAQAAPGSADRVLRDLRQSKALKYRCISRKESLYEMDSVQGQPIGNGHVNGKPKVDPGDGGSEGQKKEKP